MHIMYFLGTVYEYATLFKKCRHILFLHWSHKWRPRIYSKDVKTLLALDKFTHEITVRNSAIIHPDSERVLFASRKTGKGKGIGYYCGSPIKTNMTVTTLPSPIRNLSNDTILYSTSVGNSGWQASSVLLSFRTGEAFLQSYTVSY